MGGRRGGRRKDDEDWMGGQPSPLAAEVMKLRVHSFGLFLFRFRNNRIHGISISKRTLLDLETEYPWRR